MLYCTREEVEPVVTCPVHKRVRLTCAAGGLLRTRYLHTQRLRGHSTSNKLVLLVHICSTTPSPHRRTELRTPPLLTAISIHSFARHSPNKHAPSAGTSAARAAAEKTFSDSTTPINVKGSMLRRSTLLINRRWSATWGGWVSERPPRREENGEQRAKKGRQIASISLLVDGGGQHFLKVIP